MYGVENISRSSFSIVGGKDAGIRCVGSDSRIEVRILVVESHHETDQNEIRILVVQERPSVDLRHRPRLERPP